MLTCWIWMIFNLLFSFSNMNYVFLFFLYSIFFCVFLLQNRKLYFKFLLCMNSSFHYFNNYSTSFFTENIHFRTYYDSIFCILILLNLFTNSYRSVKFIKFDYKFDYKFVWKQKFFVAINYFNLHLINQYQNNKTTNSFSEKYLQ